MALKTRRYAAIPLAVVFGVVPTGIVCAITAPTAGVHITQGGLTTITGTISQAGTVAVSVGASSGAATIVGLTWSYAYTPAGGDVGPQTITATATATVGGSVGNATGIAITVDSASIACAITSPTAGATLTQGTPFTITGTINTPGSVVVKLGSATLGSATMAGLNWSYSWTPLVGDVGAQTLNATATATYGGVTGNAGGVSITVAASGVALVNASSTALVNASSTALLSGGPPGPAFHIPSIVTMGQSNAGGLDTDITGFVADARALYYNQGATPTHTWDTLGPDVVSTGQHGWELTGSGLLTAAAKGNVLLAKNAFGGTPIAAWLPGGSGGIYTTNLLWSVAQAAIAAIKAKAGIRSTIAFVWWLGETDATSAFSATAQADWFAACTSMAANFRSEFGGGYTLKFFVVQTHSAIGGANNAAVQAAQAQFAAADAGATLITIGIAPSAGIHWGDGQQKTIGTTYIAPAILSAYTS